MKRLLSLQAVPSCLRRVVVLLAAACGIWHVPSWAFRPQLPTPGASVLDYDITAERIEGLSRESNLLNFNAHGSNGALRHSVLAHAATVDPVRLETTLTHDTPWRARSLRTGDSVTRAGAWGRPVRFGGIQAASSFGPDREFIAQPLAATAGTAVLPSSVDVLMQSAHRMAQQDGVGAFTLSGMPVFGPTGDMSLVVLDALGREQRVTQASYAPPAVLGEGAADFSFEAGALREDFGLLSDRYGERFAAGTYRWGATPALTVEARGEVLQNQSATGLGIAWRVADLGVLALAAASSRSERGEGTLSSIGFNRHSSMLSFGGRVQRTARQFTQLGLDDGELPPERVAQFYVGTGPFALNYVDMTTRDADGDAGELRERLRLVGTSISMAAPIGTFSITALRSLAGPANYALSALLTIPLDRPAAASPSRPWTGVSSITISSVR